MCYQARCSQIDYPLMDIKKSSRWFELFTLGKAGPSSRRRRSRCHRQHSSSVIYPKTLSKYVMLLLVALSEPSAVAQHFSFLRRTNRQVIPTPKHGWSVLLITEQSSLSSFPSITVADIKHFCISFSIFLLLLIQNNQKVTLNLQMDKLLSNGFT